MLGAAVDTHSPAVTLWATPGLKKDYKKSHPGPSLSGTDSEVMTSEGRLAYLEWEMWVQQDLLFPSGEETLT